MNPIENENKVEKSVRNSKAFQAAFARASKGEFDKELDKAREAGELQGTSTRLPLLRVQEIWTIRRKFSIEKGENYFKLYKEKFYIENPGSNNFDTVSPTVYRTVVAQKEQGDAKWAKAVGEHLNVPVEANEATPKAKPAPKRGQGRPKKTA